VDPIELTENGPAVVRRLTEHQGALLEASRVVDTCRLGDGSWELTAGTKVGATRIGDLVVRIHPKVPIHRLLFLLGYARNPGWHTNPVPFDPAPDLVAALASAYARHAEHATDQGLLQGYVETDDTLTVLRGRLREQDQLRQRFAQVLPLLVRYDDYTTDIPENRLLRAAAERLLRVPVLDPQARRRLRGVLATLVDVTPLVRGRSLPAWTRTRLNARYHPALDLADLILRDNAVDLPAGAVTMDGFLVDMWQVFEDFVTTALTEALKPVGGSTRAQDDAHHLDDAGRVRIKPDLVWYHHGRPAAVIDAKYKAEKPAGFPDADLYQLLAYCTALALDTGHLVYARGNEPATTHRIANTGITIIQHTLDLDTEPVELLRQMQGLAIRVGAQSRGGCYVEA
jgi:5-methylcytosine-specific restriction enzyme subunit McrC